MSCYLKRKELDSDDEEDWRWVFGDAMSDPVTDDEISDTDDVICETLNRGNLFLLFNPSITFMTENALTLFVRKLGNKYFRDVSVECFEKYSYFMYFVSFF